MKHYLMLNSQVAQSVLRRILLALQSNIRERHGARSQFLIQALFWRTASVLEYYFSP